VPPPPSTCGMRMRQHLRLGPRLLPHFRGGDVHPRCIPSPSLSSTSIHPHPHPCALLRLRRLPHPAAHPHALSVSGSSFIEMRATRSQGRVCGVCSCSCASPSQSASRARRMGKPASRVALGACRHKCSQGGHEQR
jgi:hypothetical protein